jgi:hypothetical protein
MSLPEAVAKTKMIYDKEYTNPAAREVMVKAMGYSGINGASAQAFSALLKYGLLVSVASDQYRVSEDALNIILFSRGEKVRAGAIEAAAFAPPLFGELRDQYPGTLPSDENLTAFLVKRGFNPRSVSDLIRNYRETVEYFSTETGFASGTATVVPAEPAGAAMSVSQAKLFEKLPAESDLTFKIGRDSEVQIRFSGQVTQEAIEKLISLLNLSKDVYPTAGELVAPPDVQDELPSDSTA